MPTVIANETLLDASGNIENELVNLKENLSNETKSMYQANDEISKLVEQLEEANVKLNLSMKLMKIDHLLEKIKQHNDSEKYTEINQIINAIKLLVNDPEDKIIRRLDMYKNLKFRLSCERENMLENLKNRFNSLVQTKEKSFLKTRAITMNITKSSSKLVDCANACVESEYDFKALTDFFFNNIFEPVVSRAVSLEVDDRENGFAMSLSYSIEPVTENLRPNFGVVFINIRHILFFLLNMNVQLKSDEFFLARIFRDHRSEILELIFNECLIHSIPKTFEEKNQCTMNAEITKMSQLFTELNFFVASPDEQNLEDYSHKIDEIFYQQFTKNIQASASDLLKRDLHDMMLISEDTSISTNTPLTFPRSMVSKSTLEVIRLMEKIIQQASTCGEDLDKQNNLALSIRAVLEGYAFTVQLHHSKFISKIPQQSALFYNNCMYLSNWVASNRDTEHYGLEQVVDDLEKQGWEVLECQIAKQKIQLLDILGEFGKLRQNI